MSWFLNSERPGRQVVDWEDATVKEHFAEYQSGAVFQRDQIEVASFGVARFYAKLEADRIHVVISPRPRLMEKIQRGLIKVVVTANKREISYDALPQQWTVLPGNPQEADAALGNEIFHTTIYADPDRRRKTWESVQLSVQVLEKNSHGKGYQEIVKVERAMHVNSSAGEEPIEILEAIVRETHLRLTEQRLQRLKKHRGVNASLRKPFGNESYPSREAAISNLTKFLALFRDEKENQTSLWRAACPGSFFKIQ